MDKKKRVLFTAAAILLGALLLFDLIMLFWAVDIKEPPKTTGGVVFDPNSSDERPSEKPGVAPGVTVSGFSALTIPANIETIAIDLYNPIENNGLYYMTFTFSLLGDEGSEVLFQTGYLAPGKHIYQVTLAHGLPEGEYKAQLLVQPYRMSDLSPTNNVSAIVALTVK